eukprot:TRINITY_DN955_c0_g1_i1.p1 TRINITY_DN955_c0_g1~~TRINITY_DN955_c0_g1_i1.p1  ORF type:complete len:216 (-),score=11.07 TRINITY_DN955_c0_g1_i1:403-1050(-)
MDELLVGIPIFVTLLVLVLLCSCLPKHVNVFTLPDYFANTFCVAQARTSYLSALRSFKFRRAIAAVSGSSINPRTLFYTWYLLCFSPPTIRIAEGHTLDERSGCSWFDSRFPHNLYLNMKLVRHSIRALKEHKVFYAFLIFVSCIHETGHYLCYNVTHCHTPEKYCKHRSPVRGRGEAGYFSEEAIFGGVWLPLVKPRVCEKEVRMIRNETHFRL